MATKILPSNLHTTTIDHISNVIGLTTNNQFRYIATANQTAFTGADQNGSTLAINTANVRVFLNGSLLTLNADYTVNATTMTLNTGAQVGTEVIIDTTSIGVAPANVLQLTGGTLTGNLTLNSNLIFEGSTANDFETTVTVTDPTADRTITIPNATGTVITSGNLDDMTQQDYGLITGSITLTNDYGSVA